MPDYPELTPLKFAADRECKLPTLRPTLQSAWQRSRETLTRMKDVFGSTPLPSSVRTIYVCGSIGRMEQLPGSDCDLIIVTDDSVSPKSDEARQLHTDIWKLLEPLGMIRPKPDGIFSETVTWGQLTDRSTLGLVDEDQFVYGKRIQMLLDSQPVAHEESFRRLQTDVLARFHRHLTRDEISRPPRGDWSPLVNELIRYWKALEVRTTWLDRDDPAQWRYLNIKLKHSRRLLILGALMLLCLVSDPGLSADESRGSLLKLISLTPLERISLIGASHQFEFVLRCYEHFLKLMGEEEFVTRLRDSAVEVLNTREYRDLEENAEIFGEALHQILRQTAEQCPPYVRQALML